MASSARLRIGGVARRDPPRPRGPGSGRGSRPVRVDNIHRAAKPVFVEPIVTRFHTVTVLGNEISSPVRPATVRVAKAVFVR